MRITLFLSFYFGKTPCIRASTFAWGEGSALRPWFGLRASRRPSHCRFRALSLGVALGVYGRFGHQLSEETGISKLRFPELHHPCNFTA